MIVIISFLIFSLLMSFFIYYIILHQYIIPDISFLPKYPKFTNKKKKIYDIFPNICDKHESIIDISVIVPAYNEEDRIGKMLDTTIEFFNNHNPFLYFEIIVVNDGSKDNTSKIVEKFVQKYTCDIIRLLEVPVNCGKGHAIKKGLLHSRGKLILMADADGATDINDFDKLYHNIKIGSVDKTYSNSNIIQKYGNKHGIAIGSRAHLEQKAIAQRPFYRNFPMHVFHLLVRTVGGVNGLKDTQCGFKLFTRSTAILLSSQMHLRRWAFDVELLYLSIVQGIPIVELKVDWTEIAGSKLNILNASYTMARDLFVMRFMYIFQIWRIELTNSVIKAMLE